VDRYLSRVLYIDLSRRRYWVERRSDLFEEWIGGVGVASQLYRENVDRNADPLSPDNAIVLAVGPFVGYYPMASKTVAVFKSPLTGNWGESHCGGRSAMAIRFAGYGAIVITGASEIPIYLVITRNRVYFRDARALWGMTSAITVGRIVRENVWNPGLRTIIRIGKAGERLVRYATAITETYRHFGRLGLGAVMGAKKLKAIAIIGSRLDLRVRDKKMYREIYDKIFKMATDTPAMKKYHELGTAMNILPLHELGALPIKNLTTRKLDDIENISGEFLAREYLGRRVACAHCPVACIHIAIWRERYEEDPYFYKTSNVVYDYEPIYSLGSMLGVTDTIGLLKLLHRVDIFGLDAMSTGVILAWATEALERGIISEEETIIKLEWGAWDKYMKAVEYIISQPNEFYRSLARGLDYASKKYGGEEFAMVFAGNEMPGYHTGPAAYIGYLIGARHSHLDGAGYSLDQKTLCEKLTPEQIVDRLVKEEQWRQVLSSLVVCFFARKIYTPEIIVEAFRPLGIETSEKELKALGKKIYTEKYRIKLRDGFSLEDLSIPNRIFELETPHGKMRKDTIMRALEYFRRKILENI